MIKASLPGTKVQKVFQKDNGYGPAGSERDGLRTDNKGERPDRKEEERIRLPLT